jgi:hypothetical protein
VHIPLSGAGPLYPTFSLLQQNNLLMGKEGGHKGKKKRKKEHLPKKTLEK